LRGATLKRGGAYKEKRGVLNEEEGNEMLMGEGMEK